MKGLNLPKVGGSKGLVGNLQKFLITGLVGALVVFLLVGIFGPVIGGLGAGAAIAAMGNPIIGSVVAFDAILSLFQAGGL